MCSNHSSFLWYSVHLYCLGDFHSILTKSLKPFVDKVIKEKLITKFFFNRYSDDLGPDIRLRFYGDALIIKNQLKPRLISHFKNYVFVNINNQNDITRLKTSDFLKEIDYIPETRRYGGESCMKHAEEFFHDSSRVTLNLLSSDKWDYSIALGHSLRLSLIFCSRIGLSVSDIKLFFTYIMHSWLPIYYNSKETIYKRKSIFEFYNISFREQKEHIGESVRELWNNIYHINNKTYTEWTNGIDKYVERMKLVNHKMLPYSKNVLLSNITPSIPKEKKAFWPIYASLLHMTNNRLGILNRDESYIAYIIINTLKDSVK